MNKKTKVGIIVSIAVVLGVLLYFLFPQYFKVSYTKTYTYVYNGNTVDPATESAIIKAFMSERKIFVSGDVVVIRKYISSKLLTLTPDGQKQFAKASDSEIKDSVAQFVKIISLPTEAWLRSSDTVWSFNDKLTKVTITFKTPEDSNGYFNKYNFAMTYYGGQWYL